MLPILYEYARIGVQVDALLRAVCARDDEDTLMRNIVRIKWEQCAIACNGEFFKVLSIEVKGRTHRVELGVEYLCCERGGILFEVERNIDDLVHNRGWRVVTLYDLSVLHEVVFCEQLIEPCLLTAERYVDDVERGETEDEREDGGAEVYLLGLSPKEGDGKRIDAAERTDHGGVAQRCQPVRLIAEPDTVELDGEDGEEEEQPPFQKAGKEGKPCLYGKCAEEKGEAEERERSVPIHRADGHLAHPDDLADVEVEDEEQEEIDGEEEIEEQLLRGGGELIACVRPWQCTEECGKPPAAVCNQTGEEIGRLRQPSVRIGNNQCPECGDAEDESEKEQDARRDGKGSGKEEGGKSWGFVCSFEKKEREEGECEIDALRPNDQLAARIFHAIPRIGKEEEQDGR